MSTAADDLTSFWTTLTKPTAAAEWLASDHVTAICDQWRREREAEENETPTGHAGV